MTDADRIDFLEQWAKRSSTGITLEWSREEGFRVMTFHKIDAGHKTARAAIDAALAARAVLQQ